MTDDLNRLVAATSPVSEARIASLDLRDAEAELMEEIMAMEPTEVNFGPSPWLSDDGPGRHRLRYRVVVGAAAAAVVVGLGATGGDGADDTPETAAAAPSELPRLLASWVPDGFELTNTMALTSSADGAVTVESDDQPAVLTTGSYDAYYTPPAPGPSGLPWITLTTSSSAGNGLSPGGSAAEQVTVRGNDAQLLSAPADGSAMAEITLHWEEAPGVFVTLSAVNTELTESDLLTMAEAWSR